MYDEQQDQGWNIAWILNIRGYDNPNSPIPNSRLIISKSKKIFLISKIIKCKKLIKNKIINFKQFIDEKKLPEKILDLNGQTQCCNKAGNI